jgi:hypothetical protein
MKKKNESDMSDELRPEYDLREILKDGVRGKYAERYKQGTNLVPLDLDVAEVFANNEDAVNEALRLVIELKKLPKRKKTG